MQAYSVEKVIAQDGKIELDALPFAVGETVQIIVLPRKEPAKVSNHSALKGTVVKYLDPFEPVPQDEWAVLQ